MILKNPNNYKFLRFEKSHLPYKKYNAILINKKTKITKRIPFGAIKPNKVPYDQFKDTTGLGLYSKYDHLDKKRRARYYARFGRNAPKFSSMYFSHRFLW